ncbi:MAG: hypothetical protein FJ319_09085 [SAR202 cluster bacterium]|nr:hypothetical protein [SAR202 cluster bacterium]
MRGNGRTTTRRMRPDESSIRDLHRETTVCYSYMCPFAYGCAEKSSRPAQVLTRRCMRYQPEAIRITPGLSDQALDILARQRDYGVLLNPATTAILDRHRPNGPLRK